MATEAKEKPNHLHYLNEFRVEACPLFKQHQCQQHRPYTCYNWHFANQRRRRPSRKADGSFNYSPDIYCDKYDENTGICPDGDECTYLHRVSGDVERKYHLRYYKTAQCVHATDARGQCVKNGPHCAFAHSPTDLRQPQYDQHEAGFANAVEGESRDRTSFVIEDPLWHSQDHVLSCYKTEQCRKPARLCRQGYACPFYHNSKDRRRPPAMYKYRSTPCPAAKSVDEWLDPELCEAGDNCQYCHTRTEQQFHPEIYKSTKCNDMLEHGYCPRAVFCAFAHHDSELHVQRMPYLASCQHSPKEQDSPNTNGSTHSLSVYTDDRCNGNGGTGPSTPTYSAVLKTRHIPTNKGFSGSTEALSSSYPKAPGFERAPLSPNRADLGRLRTHSLNMGHLDLARKNQYTGFTPDSGVGSTTHSDGGFHGIPGSSTLDELSLELSPIEEHQQPRPLTELFGASQSAYQQAYSMSPTSRMEPFRPKLASFGESLMTNPKSGYPFGCFDTQPASQSTQEEEAFEIDDVLNITHDLLTDQEKFEDGLRAARQACEAWKTDANMYKMKAEQAEMERNRALYERDQVMGQLENLRMQLASASLASLPPSGSQLANVQIPPNIPLNLHREYDLMRNQYNMFPVMQTESEGPACARCGRDRSRSDTRNGCPLCSN